MASTHTSGTNHLPAIQKLAQDGLKDNLIIGKDAQGKDLPDKGKPANHAHLNRVEYSFKSQYISDADITKTPSATPFTPQSTETITQTKVDDFFAFINDLSKDGTINPDFLTELNSDVAILKEVENNLSWKIIPAQSTPLKPTQLADYGIEVANDNNTKLYLSEKPDKAVKFSITEGLKSWIELVLAFFPSSSQQTKLASAFTTDPYQQLLTAISSNTHSTHWELPESQEDLQAIADQLELKKLSVAGEITELAKEISKKKKEKTVKDTEFTSKDTELTTLIQKIITQKRELLNQSNIKEFTGDNRKTSSELFKLKLLLLEIRYLENEGDVTLPSSIADENTALTTIEDLQSKTICWIQSHWDSIGWVAGASEEENCSRPNAEKIKIIKENKSGDYVSLTYYHDQLVELEKLVKLTDQQSQIKADLKAAIDEKTPAENLQEWRDTLKTIDPSLESAFTDEKITKWKQKKDGQAKFDNTASIKTLLEKVKGDEKFIVFIKGKDTEVDTLSQLIEKKDPVEVIKLIIQYWEYEKLAEEDKKKKKQKLVWTLEKKGADGKYLEDGDLTEEEITNTLYEIALGKKILASQKKADSSETPPGDNKNEQPKWYEWGSGIGKTLYLGGGLLLVGGILTAIFWKKIKGWWKGSEDLAGESESSEIEDE
jgi:hypothetical protein